MNILRLIFRGVDTVLSIAEGRRRWLLAPLVIAMMTPLFTISRFFENAHSSSSLSCQTTLSSQMSTESKDMDPDIANLVKSKRMDLKVADFMECLKSVAKKRSWEHELTGRTELTRFQCDDAWAAPIKSGDANLIVVVIKSWDMVIPGSDVQTAMLLDNQGRFLDILLCRVNSRVSRNGRGQLHTVIPTMEEPDGSRLIIRLDGQSARGNFSHHVYHRKNELNIYWGNDKLPKDQPSELDAKGLCRIGIRDKKFDIVFPSTKEKNKHFSRSDNVG